MVFVRFDNPSVHVLGFLRANRELPAPARHLFGTWKALGSACMRYGRDFDFGARPPPPVKEGDELTVTIEGMGSAGDGLARVKGFVIFVPDTKVDDEVKIRVVKVAQKVAFAEKVDTE